MSARAKGRGSRPESSAFRVPRSAFARVLFVTGTDTGVGKTVLTALLTRHLRKSGVRVAAAKPIASGGRGDARVLHRAQEGALALDEINPWHFRAPVAPVLAARQEGRRVRLADVLAHLRRLRKRCDVLLVEGAGGLLSPLGEGFSSRELLTALGATPIVVCPNRLGAVNQVRLVLAALPPRFARRAVAVLVAPRRADAASRNQPSLVAEYLAADRVIELPWLRPGARREAAWERPRVERALAALAQAALPRRALAKPARGEVHDVAGPATAPARTSGQMALGFQGHTRRRRIAHLPRLLGCN